MKVTFQICVEKIRFIIRGSSTISGWLPEIKMPKSYFILSVRGNTK